MNGASRKRAPKKVARRVTKAVPKVVPRRVPRRVARPRTAGSGGKVRALLRELPVEAVMTKQVLTVAPDLSVERLAELFLENGISGAPVVDASGKVVGIVSKTDLVRDIIEPDDRFEGEGDVRLQARQRRGVLADLGAGFHEEAIARHTVAEIMTPVALTISRSATVGKAAAVMVREGIHRIPVMDGKKVAGIFAAMDLLRWVVA